MASWMVHLRVADILLSETKGLSDTEFVIGNIAPDSGTPNADWSSYVPPTEISHFCDNPEDKKGTISPEKFFKKHIEGKSYTQKEMSFYIGYYVHLLTDVLWHKNIYQKEKDNYFLEFHDDKKAFIWAMKGDWYDLDHLFLKKNPTFRAFNIYESTKGFKNIFMEEFTVDAFAVRQEYIVGFYREVHNNLEREYKYLTESEMNLFVDEAAHVIFQQLKEKNIIKEKNIK